MPVPFLDHIGDPLPADIRNEEATIKQNRVQTFYARIAQEFRQMPRHGGGGKTRQPQLPPPPPPPLPPRVRAHARRPQTPRQPRPGLFPVQAGSSCSPTH